MKDHHLVLLCFAFVSIFCTSSVHSADTVTIVSEHEDSKFYFPDKQRIALKCNTTGDVKNIKWEINGVRIPDDPKDKYEVTNEDDDFSVLILNGTQDSDAGNYTCRLGDGGPADTVKLISVANSKWGLRVNRNVNVVQGEKLTLKCEVRGHLQLEWWFKNASVEGDNFTKLETQGRYKIKTYKDEEQNVDIVDGQLEVDDAELTDRGEYLCTGESSDHVLQFNSTCTVRIKDKYAALWPFLGICAEVFILCAIILVYEKKRNKTELEESDTDQSPDQKNTPDHGKESNLRHRQ